ncbi:hypothetical protein [Streptomyces sp. NPDC004042]|uniref:hypothetical protein n=1 Tax=Streptomyces sp. NPDC004042 TaxID=3154451 RepID=UPI0033AD0DDE
MRSEDAVIWWFKTRRGHTLLPVALAVFAMALYAVQDTTVLLPSITGSPRIALSLFVPVPLLALLMAMLESRVPAAESSGARSVTLLDSALVTVVMAASAVCSLAVCALHGTAAATAGSRNALFLTGVMLLGRAWAGQSAVMLPVGWLVTVVVIGFRGNVPRTWTVVALPATSAFAATASLTVFAIGLAAQFRSSRRTT